MRALTAAAVVVPLTTMVSHSFSRLTYNLLLPAIKDDLGLSNAQAGTGGTVIFVAYLAGVFVVTAAARAVEPIRLLRGGVVLGTVGLSLLFVASDFALLAAGLGIANLGAAGIWITAPLVATTGIAPERRGVVIALLTASMGLANAAVALGTRTARAVADDPELWRPVYGAEAVFAAVVAVLAFVAVRGVAGGTARGEGRAFSLEALQRLPGWLPFTAAYVLFGAIASGYATFLAEALETDGGLSRETVAWMFVGFGLSSVGGSPLMGWLSDRIGRRAALQLVMVIMGVGATVVALGRGPVLIVCVITFGGMWASYPTLTATYVRDHLADRSFNTAFGTMTIAYGVAAVIPPAVMGALADAQGSFTAGYLGITGLSALGLVCLLAMPSAPGSPGFPVSPPTG